MTTRLEKAIAREFLYDGEPYKIVVSAGGIRITHKGMRKGREFGWAELLAVEESEDGAPTQPEPPRTDSGVSRAVARDVVSLADQAKEALTRAKALLEHSGELPPELERQTRWSPDAQRARIEEPRSDWFVEPLLSTKEVADLLGVSPKTVESLPIKSIRVASRRRYRASDVRLYVALQDPSRNRRTGR